MTIWLCACGRPFFQDEKPADHWIARLDGDSRICRGPFEQWYARRV